MLKLCVYGSYSFKFNSVYVAVTANPCGLILCIGVDLNCRWEAIYFILYLTFSFHPQKKKKTLVLSTLGLEHLHDF